MVDIGCQDTDQIDGCKKDVLDAISLRNEPIPATLGMDKGKCSNRVILAVPRSKVRVAFAVLRPTVWADRR